MIITRFAPSPSGSLHTGSARTALFNWLYARHTGGKFLLRIEDTDKDRNDDSVIQPIFDALSWLGLDYDDEVVYQSNNADRHREVAQELIERGGAYRCYMTPAEVEAQRTANRKTGQGIRSPWREVSEGYPEGDFVVRLRQPSTPTTTVDDKVQGSVVIKNYTLDDLILLRADGTPTYMLASVVDDHDAGVNMIIRGDDHLNNAFRQRAILTGMGWEVPTYAHIPLIHGEDGKKLSKRDGAAGVEFYRDAGYLPEAVINYLLRMGWGHGDQEIFSLCEAAALFDLDAVGKNAARLNDKKLKSLNSHYIGVMSEEEFAIKLGRRVDILTPVIKDRSKTMVEAAEMFRMVDERPAPSDTLMDNLWIVMDLPKENFTTEAIKVSMMALAERLDMKLGEVAKVARLALMGQPHTPPLFEVMEYLGRDEVVARLTNV